MIDRVIANPSAHGFTNVTDPVWTGNLTDPNSGTLNATGSAQNQFLFFDSLHPTAQAHALLASGIAQGLTSGVAKSVIAPASPAFGQQIQQVHNVQSPRANLRTLALRWWVIRGW